MKVPPNSLTPLNWATVGKDDDYTDGPKENGPQEEKRREEKRKNEKQTQAEQNTGITPQGPPYEA